MIDQDIRKLLQNRSSTEMSAIWQKAKDRDLTGLDDDQQRLAKIMVDHEDDLNLHFENAQLVYDPGQDPDTDYDPFLHITVHAIVEAQLEVGDPIEVVQFFNAMRQKKYDRHDATHLVGQILIYFIYYSNLIRFVVKNKYKKTLSKSNF